MSASFFSPKASSDEPVTRFQTHIALERLTISTIKVIMRKIIRREFPLSFIHAGTTLGNGELGLSVWGENRTLNLSLGSSLLWDHRGGMSWNAKQNMSDICKALTAGDRGKLEAIFAVDASARVDYPLRPSLIPLGRITIQLPKGAKLDHVALALDCGMITAFYNRGGETKQIRFLLSQQTKGAFTFKAEEKIEIQVRPAYELSDALKGIGFSAPKKLEYGFCQSMPADPAFLVAGKKSRGNEWCFCFSRNGAENVISFADLKKENRAYWRSFWAKVPEIISPDSAIEELYSLGLFKFQSMTSADGYPAGLQGPWIEDDTFPPWSGDYHFNINVEMCYWPAYHSGLWDNLMPMFRMVLDWREKMRFNAKCFVGIEDGYMMPHAVDDHCVCMGSFWAGCIDHACAAWIAQMMMDYVRYTGDVAFLRQDAFDFMRGVMRVYEAMLDKDGTALSLPVGVSPEYRGNRMDAWGKNASFQLAAIHRLADDLVEAAALLDEEPTPVWLKIQQRLPQATVEELEGNPEIFLWQGTPLEESHRHHSHLAALCPFNTIQPDDPVWAEVLENSRRRWVGMGMGNWAGWSMPWAIMLHNRFQQADMAVTLIDFWRRCYTNSGGGTLHDPQFGGVSLGLCGNNRVMQMDAGMGMVTAIADLFIYETAGTLYPLHGVPDSWKNFEVKRICCSNGLRFAAKRANGVTSFTLSATRPVKIRVCVAKKYVDVELLANQSFKQNINHKKNQEEN